jgi:hypothetical protein
VQLRAVALPLWQRAHLLSCLNSVLVAGDGAPSALGHAPRMQAGTSRKRAGIDSIWDQVAAPHIQQAGNSCNQHMEHMLAHITTRHGAAAAAAAAAACHSHDLQWVEDPDPKHVCLHTHRCPFLHWRGRVHVCPAQLKVPPAADQLLGSLECVLPLAYLQLSVDIKAGWIAGMCRSVPVLGAAFVGILGAVSQPLWAQTAAVHLHPCQVALLY